MKIVTSLLDGKRETTLDALLDLDMRNLFVYWIENPEHRDYVRGYALVRGIDFPVVDGPVDKSVNNLVTITFLDLSLL